MANTTSSANVAWSQGRTGVPTDMVFERRRDVNGLFGVPPDNSFPVKFSYGFQL